MLAELSLLDAANRGIGAWGESWNWSYTVAWLSAQPETPELVAASELLRVQYLDDAEARGEHLRELAAALAATPPRAP